jgi:THO complex subunit 4
MSSGLDMSLDDLIKQSKSRPKANPASSSGPARRAPQAVRAAPYPPAALKVRCASPSCPGLRGPSLREKTLTLPAPPAGPVQGRAAGSPYGIYADHVATLAAAVPAPASARSLETGTKLYISNLDPGVTIEDVQVILLFLLLAW